MSQGKLSPPQLQAGALTGTANQHIPDLWVWYGFKEACDSVQSEWISGFLLGMLGQKWLLVSGSFWHGSFSGTGNREKTKPTQGRAESRAVQRRAGTSLLQSEGSPTLLLWSDLFHHMWDTAAASPDFRERELLSCYLHTGPEKETCLGYMRVCWTCHH